jgi:cell division septum initiation protein DivIVA
VLRLTEKELKKMTRYQLLELLLLQTERADKLQNRLDETERKLNNLDIEFSSLGSIAEASLQLRGVFQAAQDAADMYINAAKKRADEIEEEAHKKSDAIIAQALKEAGRIKGE